MIINKQLLNSVLVGYEELLRQRFVITQTEALIIPHILRVPNSIIVLFMPVEKPPRCAGPRRNFS